MRKKPHPFAYAIVVRVQNGYFTASQPDLEIHRGRKFSDVSPADVGRMVLEVFKEVIQQVSKRDMLPQPRPVRVTREEAVSMRAATQALGLSSTTVKRMCDEGKLQHWTTPGGHRRIFIDEARIP